MGNREKKKKNLVPRNHSSTATESCHVGKCPRRAHSIVGMDLSRQGLSPFSDYGVGLQGLRAKGIMGPRELGLKVNSLGFLKV